MAQWNLDPTHFGVTFAVRHMMVSTVRGRFSDASAQIDIDEEAPERSRVVAEIPTATIDTGMADRDVHLRSADFFDAEQYPVMTFESTSVERRGDEKFTITGNLTIRDVTRPLTLRGEIQGPVADPWGNRRAGIELTGEIDRETWGLVWNMGLETGGVLVGKTVKLAIEGEIVAAVPVAAM